jgi:hypothetical protein
MRGPSSFRLVLVALAVLAALSHVCALPLHAEAHHEPVAPHATPTEAHDDGASCEAASPAPSHAALALAPMAAADAEPALPVPVSPALELRSVFSRSSPLFVLFLTLRI